MKKSTILIIILLVTTNLFSQEKEKKSEFSVGLGFVNIKFENDFFPSFNPVLLSTKYKYNFHKQLSFNTELKFANGFKHVPESETGVGIISYYSIGIFPIFNVIKKRKFELQTSKQHVAKTD